jgi:hypothetical protein
MMNRLLIVSIFLFHSASVFSNAGVANKISFHDSIFPIQAFRKVIPEGTKGQIGIFTVYRLMGRIFFDIPDCMLSKDILCVNRIMKGATGTKSYSGDENNNFVVCFEKVNGNRILLRKKIYQTYTADSSRPSTRAVVRTSFMPILASFDILAFSPFTNGCLINFTDYVLADNDAFSINAMQKGNNNITGMAIEKCYIDSVYCYPLNIEIASVKTYNTSQSVLLDLGTQTTAAGTPISFEINTSFVKLPEQFMRQRLADQRVGYFSISQRDFDGKLNGLDAREYITRWNLKPKSADIEKYISGELVEPEQPIIFYIDPATPEKWIPYLIMGVNDWNVAFAQAGFKNAIFAKRAPNHLEDSTWSLYDARHSAIVYKPSDIENAQGPSITDPRTGEILESHINFYSNVTQLIHDWYMVQCGAVDSNAAKLVFSDKLMGELIRIVISHEVGHTLGLMHNMYASSTVPVDSLRNKKWVEANGISPSIMDYARYNYVAQPEDKISFKGLVSRIGVYDKWAIEWGYKCYFNLDSESETNALSRMVTERTKDIRLGYGPERNSTDPRMQREDIGDNQMVAAEYGIKNLKRILPHLSQWAKAKDNDAAVLIHLYNEVQEQYLNYLSHAVSYFGGTYLDLKNNMQQGPVFSKIPFKFQKQAETFLNTYFFITPKWLIDSAIIARTGLTGTGIMAEIQNNVLRNLLTPTVRFNLMVARNSINYISTTESYSLNNLLRDIKNDIWKELKEYKPIDIYRRSLQLTFIHCLLLDFTDFKTPWRMFIFSPIDGKPFSITGHDAIELLYAQLKDLYNQIKRALPHYKNDEFSKNHLSYILYQIDNIMNNPSNKACNCDKK